MRGTRPAAPVLIDDADLVVQGATATLADARAIALLAQATGIEAIETSATTAPAISRERCSATGDIGCGCHDST